MSQLVESPAAIAQRRRLVISPATDLSLSRDWHAVYTRHQHEKSVALHLEQNGIEVFLPVYSEIHRWSDRHKEVEVPLFPCYVFFSGGLERRAQILNTPGICSLVTSGGKIAVIPAAELLAIEHAMQGNLAVEPHPFLQTGDRIRVHSGPLAGVEGIVIRVKDSMRIVLSVEILCRSVAIEVNGAIVEHMPAR